LSASLGKARLNNPPELSRLMVGEPPDRSKKLRHRDGSAKIVLAGLADIDFDAENVRFWGESGHPAFRL
jgi:hypothetical protein